MNTERIADDVAAIRAKLEGSSNTTVALVSAGAWLVAVVAMRVVGKQVVKLVKKPQGAAG